MEAPSHEGAFLRPVEITSYIVEDDETLLRNYRDSIARNLPTIHIRPAHAGKWIIAGGGPSLRDEIRALKKHKKRGDVIIAVNGTHDYLIEHGIIPDYMIVVDPKQSNKRFLEKSRDDVTYLIGACCHPETFDIVSGRDVKIWYPINHCGETELIANMPVQIGGGTTVGLRAINIGYVLGYRDIQLYGMDGCLKEDKHHAYQQKENDGKQIMDIHLLGKVYYCHVWMAQQADNFIQFMKLYKHDMKIKVHTPGILKHIADHINQST